MTKALFLPIPARNSGRRGRPLQVRILAVLAVWRSRRDLAQLDAHLLRDVGLTADQARHESARPFWDVPPHWRL